MEQSDKQQDKTTKQIAVLQAISIKYRKVIVSNNIVQHDMEELIGSIRTSDPLSSQYCKKIINHLLAEIHESVYDEQRMDDEWSNCQNAQNTYNSQDYFLFKDAMADFYQRHIKQSTHK